VTGDTIGLPHLAHDKRYNAAPNFWMLAAPPDPGMKNPRLAALQGTEGNEFKFYLREHRSPFPLAIVTTLKSFRQSFGWTALLLLLVPFAYRDKPTKRVGLVLVLALAGVALTVFHLPHYGAPLVALIALLIACSAAAALRHRIGSIIAAILFLTAASMSVYNRQSDWKNGARPMALSINRPELIRRLSDWTMIISSSCIILRRPGEWMKNGFTTARISTHRKSSSRTTWANTKIKLFCVIIRCGDAGCSHWTIYLSSSRPTPVPRNAGDLVAGAL
jgi:hypothetical protein